MKSALTIFLMTFMLIIHVQHAAAQNDVTIRVNPDVITVDIGETIKIDGRAYDASGNALPDSVIFFTRSRRAVAVTRGGEVTGLRAGNYQILATYVDEAAGTVQQNFSVTVNYPPVTAIDLSSVPGRMYTNTWWQIEPVITDASGAVRDNVDVSYSVNHNRASVSEFGMIEAKQTGTVTLTVRAESVTTQKTINIAENPVTAVQITNETTQARTGDVIRVNAKALNSRGSEVADAPIDYSFMARPDDQLGQGATAQIEQDGRFVANKPGVYTLIAKSGNAIARQTVRVDHRDIQRRLEVVGHGKVIDVHTSDLWVWEGVDGRDYAITGTWGGNGAAYFWDVTDPSNLMIVDTVIVDARTVNDVKISADGTLAVITREGASSRRNGIVILDVTDPRNVEILSEYDDDLTGGVHNVFIYENHVYAVNNGRRYDIINIDDPRNPYFVSRFELDTPGRAIHDVWIEDGIAYSSNWSDGIVVVDVGSTPLANTPEGHEIGVGSPSNPVKLGQYAYPSGWNHAAFPFKSESTGDFYVIAGDEAFPNGLFTTGRPTIPAGWIHFIKFDGWDNPSEVARYEIPEAGTHNMWVDGDVLYVAYYNAGLRVVDISGELMGNLYDQGREIAHYVPTYPEGLVPNAAMVWGPQPYKGHIFISDWNSGLWALKFVDE